MQRLHSRIVLVRPRYRIEAALTELGRTAPRPPPPLRTTHERQLRDFSAPRAAASPAPRRCQTVRGRAAGPPLPDRPRPAVRAAPVAPDPHRPYVGADPQDRRRSGGMRPDRRIVDGGFGLRPPGPVVPQPPPHSAGHHPGRPPLLPGDGAAGHAGGGRPTWPGTRPAIRSPPGCSAGSWGTRSTAARPAIGGWANRSRSCGSRRRPAVSDAWYLASRDPRALSARAPERPRLRPSRRRP
jgi:hypothetical protein